MSGVLCVVLEDISIVFFSILFIFVSYFIVGSAWPRRCCKAVGDESPLVHAEDQLHQTCSVRLGGSHMGSTGIMGWGLVGDHGLGSVQGSGFRWGIMSWSRREIGGRVCEGRRDGRRTRCGAAESD